MIAPTADYHNPHPEQHPFGRDPERRYMFRKARDVVKAAVPVIDEADLLCGPAGKRTGLRKVGERWVGRCPTLDHEDRTPSFVVYPNDSWYCFGCCRGGDVLDLHQLAHGYASKWEALVSLAAQRGVELPERPQSWHGWQQEKGRRRAELTKIRTALYQRRLLRLFKEDLESISDSEERGQEAQRIYSDLFYLARLCAEGRAQR